MKDKNGLREELESLSPFLRKLKEKETGMQAPENYFKELPDRVLSQIREEIRTKAAPQKPGSSWVDNCIQYIQWFLQPRAAVAFGVVLLGIIAGVIFWNYEKTTPAPPIAAMEEVSSEELYDYLESNIEDFDSELLLELGWSEQQPGFFNEFDFDVNDINDYLEENIDEIDHRTLENLF
ncbi:MAG TPA: hypothetical protein PKC40_00110 [Saprospiraceae bacterium]|nr:hypothetical protein [Saprospiraceae bacterium]